MIESDYIKDLYQEIFFEDKERYVGDLENLDR